MINSNVYNSLTISYIFNHISNYIDLKDVHSMQQVSKKFHALVQQECFETNHNTIINREYLASFFLQKNPLLQHDIKLIIQNTIPSIWFQLTVYPLSNNVREIIKDILITTEEETIKISAQFINDKLIKWLGQSYHLLEIKQIGRTYTFQKVNKFLLSYMFKDLSKNLFSKKRRQFIHSSNGKIMKIIYNKIFDFSFEILKKNLEDSTGISLPIKFPT